ncbi:hypothetical protein Clacol_010340 [Clathrus columnatus]|uniref:Integral membrane protein n=1 Tax=Clathrus columnatus TaxID=1419009 RepID=A0AAV5ATG7_9AGAM|nr:hypothetical protein Clacol_010340 [Clathrus columnatus]
MSLSLCNSLSTLEGALSILALIGIQGLIFIRTYALCQGYRPMTIAWSATFLAALVSVSYGAFVLKICTSSSGNKRILVATIPPDCVILLALIITTRIHNLCLILLDTLAFIALIHQIWGLWKLKQSLGLHNKQSLTALLIKQDLRRRNQQNSVPNQSALHLPTILFRENPVKFTQSAFGRLHESIVAEMRERDDQVNVDELSLGESDHGLRDCSPGASLDYD